ncbi:hypothetical protein V8E51_002830 [Hyaloscypha variabilis]
MANSIGEDILMLDAAILQPDVQTTAAQQLFDIERHNPHAVMVDMPSTERPAARARPISEFEWPQLRSMLRRLYIEQDQSLKAVRRYLRETRGLIATEKQLTRKFSQWGCKKNVKAQERKALLEEFKNSTSESWIREGSGKITQKKMIRWEKEAASASTSDPHLSADETHSIQDGVGEAPGLGSTQIVPLPRSNDGACEIGSAGKEDISILLSRLFAKFDLGVPSGADSVYVEATKSVDAESSHSEFVSEFVSFEDRYTIVPCGNSKRHGCHESIVQQHVLDHPPGARPIASGQQGSLFKWANMDVIFPTGFWVTPSPYNELYPFPTTTTLTAKSNISSSITSVSQYFLVNMSDTKLKERLLKIEKLQQLCSPNHLGLLSEMYAVARAYYARRHSPNYADCGNVKHWSKQIIDSPFSEATEAQVLVAKSWLLLSWVLYRERRDTEAMDAHRAAHHWILNSGVVDEEFTEVIFHIGGFIARQNSELSEVESQFWQLAQIRLTKYGPRYGETVNALRLLAEDLVHQKRYSEGEDLLMIMLELMRSSLYSGDPAAIQLFSSFGWTLQNQKRYAEAEDRWKFALEQANKHFGDSNYMTLDAETGLAEVLKLQGRYAESERLLRKNIEKLLRVLGDNWEHSVDAVTSLCEVLIETDQLEEATTWSEKSLQMHIALSGRTHPRTFRSCIRLMGCYRRQKRYGDSLSLAKSYLEEVDKASANGQKYIDKLERWIELQRSLEREDGNAPSQIQN